MHGRARRTPDTDLCPHDVIAQHERKNRENYIRENGQVASPPLDQKSHPTICQVCSKIGSAPATCARSASLRRSRGFFSPLVCGQPASHRHNSTQRTPSTHLFVALRTASALAVSRLSFTSQLPVRSTLFRPTCTSTPTSTN